jgi:hypothetical protein
VELDAAFEASGRLLGLAKSDGGGCSELACCPGPHDPLAKSRNTTSDILIPVD